VKEENDVDESIDLHDTFFTTESYDEWDDGATTDDESHIEQLLVPTKHLMVSLFCDVTKNTF
jgi:hypothetical protein